MTPKSVPIPVPVPDPAPIPVPLPAVALAQKPEPKPESKPEPTEDPKIGDLKAEIRALERRLEIVAAERDVLTRANANLQIEQARLHSVIDTLRSWLTYVDGCLRPVQIDAWHVKNAEQVKRDVRRALRGEPSPAR